MAATYSFGQTLVIVNPTAHSGAAGTIAERLSRFLTLYLHEGSSFEVKRTERPRHATEMAAGAAGYDTVLALGGDGVIHEVACGLMTIPEAERPVLGVIPVGSGNDFARTLGIREVTCDADLVQTLTCEPMQIDVGRIRYTSSTDAAAPLDSSEYFVETFSFGLDAAIAHGTAALRRTTKLAGAPLYTLSGLNVFGAHYRSYPVRLRLDGGEKRDLKTIICAVQNGPTYGSGYRITPDADPQDGVFDICYATGPLPRALALPVFLSAKEGKHVTNRHVTMGRARTVSVDFIDGAYPAQADGEALELRRAEIDLLPRALTVLAPAR